jgi:hypothetical protein
VCRRWRDVERDGGADRERDTERDINIDKKHLIIEERNNVKYLFVCRDERVERD